MEIPAELRGLIEQLTFHRVDFGKGTDSDHPEADREQVAALADANVVSSVAPGPEPSARHAVLLDLDERAWLIPSTTEGHSHLYVDVRCDHEDYVEFLKAAARIGLIQPGYASISIDRGYTSVRLPWVKKEVAS